MPRNAMKRFRSSVRFCSSALGSGGALLRGSLASFSFSLPFSFPSPSLAAAAGAAASSAALASASFASASFWVSNSDSLWPANFKYAARKTTKDCSRSPTSLSKCSTGRRRVTSSESETNKAHHCLQRSVSEEGAPGAEACSKSWMTTEAVASSILVISASRWPSSPSRRRMMAAWSAYSKSSTPGAPSAAGAAEPMPRKATSSLRAASLGLPAMASSFS
mmetsp:Transcript_68024/g.176721  ORF Transcript_68024/g.176721 Transcript_68024/m.176721 type:complete len:220 (+) Transcript_68024:128-787(+)